MNVEQYIYNSCQAYLYMKERTNFKAINEHYVEIYVLKIFRK